MINEAVEYTEDQAALIQQYIARGDKSGNDWSNEEFKDVKSAIKKHYKVEQNYTCPYCLIVNPVIHGMAWDIEHIIAKNKKAQFMF